MATVIDEQLVEQYNRIFQRIDEQEYPCIHSFFADVLRFVHGDEIYVTDEDGTVICHIWEGKVRSLKEYITEHIKTWGNEIQRKWSRWKVEKVSLQKRMKPKLLLITPVLFRTIFSGEYKRCLVVFVSPRLIRAELAFGEVIKSLSELDLLLKIVSYWFALDIYGLDRRKHRYSALKSGTLPDAEKIGIAEQLVTKPFIWPFGFRDLIDVFNMAWTVLSRNENKAEFVKKVTGKECKHEECNKLLWDWLEGQIEKNLCVDESTCRCRRGLFCPEDEREKKEHYRKLYKVVKWWLANYEGGKFLPFEPEKKDFNEAIELHKSLYDESETLACLNGH